METNFPILWQTFFSSFCFFLLNIQCSPFKNILRLHNTSAGRFPTVNRGTKGSECIFLRQLAKEHSEDDSGPVVSPSSQKTSIKRKINDLHSESQVRISLLLQLYVFYVGIVCTLIQQQYGSVHDIQFCFSFYRVFYHHLSSL